MDPVTLAILSAVPGLIKSGVGAAQLIKSKKYSEAERPVYKTPESQKKVTDLARKEAARNKLAGRDRIENVLSGRTARGISALKESAETPRDIAAGVVGLTGVESNALANLQAEEEAMKERNIARLQSALGVEAAYEDKAFDINEMQDYLNSQRASLMLGQSGAQNLAGGLGESIGGGIGSYMQADYLDYMKSVPTAWENFMRSNRPTAPQSLKSKQPSGYTPGTLNSFFDIRNPNYLNVGSSKPGSSLA